MTEQWRTHSSGLGVQNWCKVRLTRLTGRGQRMVEHEALVASLVGSVRDAWDAVRNEVEE